MAARKAYVFLGPGEIDARTAKAIRFKPHWGNFEEAEWLPLSACIVEYIDQEPNVSVASWLANKNGWTDVQEK